MFWQILNKFYFLLYVSFLKDETQLEFYLFLTSHKLTNFMLFTKHFQTFVLAKASKYVILNLIVLYIIYALIDDMNY